MPHAPRNLAQTLAVLGLVALPAVLIEACGNAAQVGNDVICPALFFPPPTLAFPSPGATGVATTLGDVLLAGGNVGFTFAVTSPAGPVARETPVPAPTPLPSALPTTGASGATYLALVVPRLSPQTTYTVTATTIPDACTPLATTTLGAFTTGS